MTARTLRRILEVTKEITGARDGQITIVGPNGELLTVVGSPPAPSEPGSACVVPIALYGERLGTLSVAHAVNGFDDAARRHVQALAEVAGITLHNMRDLERAERRQGHLQASTDVAVALLSEAEPEEALDLVARNAQQVLAAQAAVLVLPNMANTWMVEIAAGGLEAHRLIGTVMPPGGRTHRTVAMLRGTLVPDLSRTPDLLLPVLAQFGPALYAPLAAQGQIGGVLVVLRAIGDPQFSAEDLADAEAFARQAAIALTLAEARRHREVAHLASQRAEIARDLHDFVVQEMFATGAGLNSLANQVATGGQVRAEELQEVLRRLDTAVLAVRQAVRTLRDPGAPTSLMTRLENEIGHAAGQLGYRAALHVDAGAAGARLETELVEDLAAITREALSNVARHARARHAQVRAGLADGALNLEIEDDGCGLPASQRRRSGLGTMQERANRHGGVLRLMTTLGAGTTVSVDVPVRTGDDPAP